MNGSRPTIEVAAVDIDDTTCLFYQPYVDRAQARFSVHRDIIWREDLVDRAHVEWHPSVFPLTPGAAEGLEAIAQVYPIVFVSARPTELIDVSHLQIGHHLPDLEPLDIIHVGRKKSASRGPAASKYDALVERGYLAVVAFEDNVRAATDYLEHDVETFFVTNGRGRVPPPSDKLHAFDAHLQMWSAGVDYLSEHRAA